MHYAAVSLDELAVINKQSVEFLLCQNSFTNSCLCGPPNINHIITVLYTLVFLSAKLIASLNICVPCNFVIFSRLLMLFY